MHASNGVHEPAPRGGRGPGGFGPRDMERLWEMLDPHPGEAFADLGCGMGHHALEAARRVGPTGRVWALDRDRGMLAGVQAEARARHLTHLCTVRAELGEPLPLRAACLDLCLLATAQEAFTGVLAAGLLGEIRRVLRPGGRLAILARAEEDTPDGSPEQPPVPAGEMDGLARSHGLVPAGRADLGPNRLSLYRRA